MVKQLSVFLQNRSGKIASITRALAENSIDIRALSIADTTDFGILRMLVSDIQAARRVLADQNCIVSVNEVTVVAIPDEPGSLSKVLSLMAQEKIDIEYMYSVFGRTNGHAYMIFRVSDPEGLAAIASAAGLHPADGAELGVC